MSSAATGEYPRPILNYVFGDCTNGLNLTQVHDIGKLSNVEFWPFLNANQTWNEATYTINTIIQDGSLYEITFTTAPGLDDGDTVWITGSTGAQGASGKWVLGHVNGTTDFTLTGSAFTPSVGGSTVSGSGAISVNSVANIAIGQTVSDTGGAISGSPTVLAVWPNNKTVYLSATAGSTVGSDTFTFTNTAYTTNSGTATLDPVAA